MRTLDLDVTHNAHNLEMDSIDHHQPLNNMQCNAIDYITFDYSNLLLTCTRTKLTVSTSFAFMNGTSQLEKLMLYSYYLSCTSQTEKKSSTVR